MKLRFIDLFAGLGGFHKALSNLGHECVFASELEPNLRKLYQENWGIEAHGDIRKIVENEIDIIPEHDVLCAGFPCQPFSKAGNQAGREDKVRGNLFDEIVKVLEFRKPKYFILENVAFLAKHKNEETWLYMESELKRVGYEVDSAVYSPHQFGIPQHRLRVFIVGCRRDMGGLQSFSWFNKAELKTRFDIHDFINYKSTNVRKLPQAETECLQLWQNFIQAIPSQNKILGAPIWGMEFGATYPYGDDDYPHKLTEKELSGYRGNFGKPLSGMTREEQFKNLPSYARVEEKFPSWKKSYIRQSRQFYIDNKEFIEEIVSKISLYPHQSWQKLEWNVGEGAERDLFKYIIQFRASGIRVKKVDFFPSLVCTHTQVPILGWEKRYLTQTEGAQLQALEGIQLPENDNTYFKLLGNAA
jgi:DNA (cytosine-5)-methyltransferase 1